MVQPPSAGRLDPTHVALIQPNEIAEPNETAKQIPAAARQSIFGPNVVIGRHDIVDFGGTSPDRFIAGFGKIVLFGNQTKGSTLVHRWTPQ